MHDRSSSRPPARGSRDGHPIKRRKTFSTTAELPRPRASSWPPQSSEVAVSSGSSSSSMIMSDEEEEYYEDEYIIFISITGKRYQWPFDVCRKWQEMKHLIACAHGTDLEHFPIEDDCYELHNSDNYVILKEIWERVVRPGETITMHWSPQPQLDPQRLLPPPPLPPLPPSPSPSHSEASAMDIEGPAALEDNLGPLDETRVDPPVDPQPYSEDLILLDVPEPELEPEPAPEPAPEPMPEPEPAPEPEPVHAPEPEPEIPPAPLTPPPPPPPSEPLVQEPEPPQESEPQKEVSEPEKAAEATISTPLSFKFNGKTYALPFDGCRTWHKMEDCIKNVCGYRQHWGCHDSLIEIRAYELIHHAHGECEVVLPSVWELLVEPGWVVEMRMIPLALPGPDLDVEPELEMESESESPERPESPIPLPPEPIPPPPEDVYIPNDARQVELEAKGDGAKAFYYFLSPVEKGKYYKTERSEWFPRKYTFQGREEVCFLYTGKKTGLHFFACSFPAVRSSKRKRGH